MLVKRGAPLRLTLPGGRGRLAVAAILLAILVAASFATSYRAGVRRGESGLAELLGSYRVLFIDQSRSLLTLGLL